MAENNNLTYDAWKEYLKNDKEMKSKRDSLIALWENVKKELGENLESLPYSEALRRRKALTAKNIFNLISTAKEKPNFSWIQKLIYNEEDERHEYVIQCVNPSSDYIFRQIKLERWVANMHGESINKYLQPVANQIWALKAALKVSVNPEAEKSDLSYENLKTKVDEWAENHYWGNDRDIVEDWEVVLNSEYEHVPVKNSEVVEDETIAVTRMEKTKNDELVEEKKEDTEASKEEEKIEEEKESEPKKRPEQLEIPFEYED